MNDKQCENKKISLQDFKDHCIKQNVDTNLIRKFGFRKIKELALN